MNPWGTNSVQPALTLTDQLAAVEVQKHLAFSSKMRG